MQKSDLTDEFAQKGGLTKAKAKELLDLLFGAQHRDSDSEPGLIVRHVLAGRKVQLNGFGIFSLVPVAARTGLNPATGEALRIPASKRPKFAFSRVVKAAAWDKHAQGNILPV
jgi:DNA-binding protein HU-beta